jgi:hypothetical protein
MTNRSHRVVQRYPPLIGKTAAVDTESIVQEVLAQIPDTSHTHGNLPLLDSLTVVDNQLTISGDPVPGLLIINDW